MKFMKITKFTKKIVSLMLALLLTAALVPVMTMPVSADIGGYATISASSRHNLAIKSDGSLYAWGFNTYGQLGIGGISQTYVLAPEYVMDDVTMVSAGNSNSLAIKSDGSLWAWGNDYYG